MSYAIIQTGGKQYRVSQGDRLRVEVLDAEPGSEVELGPVKAVGEGAELTVGTPDIEGKSVKARVVRHGRGTKIHIWKFKRRKGYSKRQGHRQNFTEVEILSIP
jgi:large subunit ribosomal protein L21